MDERKCMAVRLSPDWLTKADDRILEYLDEEVKASPGEMADDKRIKYNRKYIQRRLKKLTDAGLITRVHRGQYLLSDLGAGYLAGQKDLSNLDEP